MVSVSEAGLRIRVDDALRQDFIRSCKQQDTTAAQILRAFMRTYVEKHGGSLKQSNMFEEASQRRSAKVASS